LRKSKKRLDSPKIRPGKKRKRELLLSSPYKKLLNKVKMNQRFKNLKK